MTKGTKNAKRTSKATSKPQTAHKASGSKAKPQNAPKAQIATQTPYREGSNYERCLTALRGLGVGRFHDFSVIVPLVKKAMGADYKAFAAKEARNEETHKDATGRIITNLSVISRSDYGKPIRDLLKMEVRFNGREKKAGLFKLGSK